MPKQNTLNRLVGAGSPAQGSLAVPVLALASNTETLFTNQAGGVAVLYPLPPTTTLAGFGSGFDGFPFRVRAAFKVTTGGTSTAIISIYANQVGTTITSGNKVATITSQSLATTSTSGYLQATLIWDSTYLKLSGGQEGAFGTTVVTGGAALTNTAISIPAFSNLNFSVTANLGSNVSGNNFWLTEFAIEAV